jgi:hypothetical protein
MNTRAQLKLLHTWITSVIEKQHLVQIDQINGPTEYLSYTLASIESAVSCPSFCFLTLVTGPRRSDTRVYEPQIRALLVTTTHFCEVIVLKLGAVPV